MRTYFLKLSENREELTYSEKEYLRKIEKEYETNGPAVLFARIGEEISFVFPISNDSRFLSIGRLDGGDFDVDEYETDKSDEELIGKGLSYSSSLY